MSGPLGPDNHISPKRELHRGFSVRQIPLVGITIRPSAARHLEYHVLLCNRRLVNAADNSEVPPDLATYRLG